MPMLSFTAAQIRNFSNKTIDQMIQDRKKMLKNTTDNSESDLEEIQEEIEWLELIQSLS